MRMLGELLARATPRVFVTQAILAFNTLVFVAMVVTGVSVMEPSIEDLLKWGADFGPSTLLGGQPWRVLSCAFVHIGLVHFAVNMWSLWAIGRFCERLYGNLTFALIYLLSAVGGSLASIAWDPLVVSAGASGALFGIDGAMLAFLYLQPSGIPLEDLRKLRNEVVRIIGINLVLGLGMGFDNAAHVGGLVTGAVAGALVARDLRDAEPVGVLRLARLLGVLVLLGGATFLAFQRVDTDPKVSSNRFSRESYAALEAGDYARTVERTTQGLERVPTYAPLYSLRGYAQQRLGRKDLALADYAKALELDPKDADALLYRCMFGSQDASVEGALEDCTKFLSVDSDRAAYALAARADILMRQQKLDAAKADVDRALELAPDMIDARSTRAWLALERNEMELAEADFTQLLASHPEWESGYSGRATARQALGRSDEALADLDKALSLAPDMTQLYSKRGLALGARGDYLRAIADHEEALRREPEEATHHNNRAWMLLFTGRFQEALVSANRAVELKPESAFIRGTRCWTRASLGDEKGAIEDCRKSVALDAEMLFDEGMLHWLQKRPAAALAAWEKALEKFPEQRALVEPWMERARRAAAR
ncbi:rhomboid family intramembrane serine protease [Archangium sp.]|jgi:membrane associated rhomboid family serine protease/tetratricopeptide (TPR) repeat protein|uniref:rhomboid family intramembrane serine protease n=1 Tax=Archangium sp. TaxID=1872627 RepID=UPI002EDB723F